MPCIGECGTLDFPSAGEQTALASASLVLPLQRPALHPTRDTELCSVKPLGLALMFFVIIKLGRWQLLISPNACVLRSTFSIKAQRSRWHVAKRSSVITGLMCATTGDRQGCKELLQDCILLDIHSSLRSWQELQDNEKRASGYVRWASMRAREPQK